MNTQRDLSTDIISVGEQGPVELAIVIPAFKAEFLEKTLSSIANQSCKRFTVYIGDDASPHDLEGIVNQFSDKIDIRYTKFKENLGKTQLINHWNRCIDLVGTENWIWFFSDDDIMATDCVEAFYARPAQDKYNVLRFNISVIDSNDALYTPYGKKYPDFPSHYDAPQFAQDRLSLKQQSYMIEYVFEKESFIRNGKFVNFDLAWGADVATIIKNSHPKGIQTLPDGRVFWRFSSFNISPSKTPSIQIRKFVAEVELVRWAISFFRTKDYPFKLSPYKLLIRRGYSLGMLKRPLIFIKTMNDFYQITKYGKTK